jgi:uncharacterized protein involved in exopolysaccharide biosynthesis
MDNNGTSGQDPQATEIGRPSVRAARPAGPMERSGRLPPVERGDGAQVSDYGRALYRRRWLAISVFVTCILATLVYSFVATPVYSARTRLLIEADDPNVVSFKSVIDEQQARADYYTTQYNVLQSRSLARLTLDSLRLWATPPFGGEVRTSRFSLGGLVSRSVTGSPVCRGGRRRPSRRVPKPRNSRQPSTHS